MARPKKEIIKEEIKETPKKQEKLVRMYHGLKSVIDIPECQVDVHLSAGWRLEK